MCAAPSRLIAVHSDIFVTYYEMSSNVSTRAVLFCLPTMLRIPDSVIGSPENQVISLLCTTTWIFFFFFVSRAASQITSRQFCASARERARWVADCALDAVTMGACAVPCVCSAASLRVREKPRRTAICVPYACITVAGRSQKHFGSLAAATLIAVVLRLYSEYYSTES